MLKDLFEKPAIVRLEWLDTIYGGTGQNSYQLPNDSIAAFLDTTYYAERRTPFAWDIYKERMTFGVLLGPRQKGEREWIDHAPDIGTVARRLRSYCAVLEAEHSGLMNSLSGKRYIERASGPGLLTAAWYKVTGETPPERDPRKAHLRDVEATLQKREELSRISAPSLRV